jgi:hypothetical protein
METEKSLDVILPEDGEEFGLVAGNWRGFDSFCWHSRPEDGEEFAIVYTNSKGSELIEQSNAAIIAAALEPFEESGDVIPECHNHWACGWIEGFAIRVSRDGELTAAAKTWIELSKRIADYPVLDEDDYYKREHDAQDEAWENWARSEFESAIEKGFEVELSEGVFELFQGLSEKSNTYWEGDSIDIDRIVNSATLDDIRPHVAPQGFALFRDGELLTYGGYHCGEFSINVPLYAPELEAVIAAWEAGEETADLGGVLTWAID